MPAPNFARTAGVLLLCGCGFAAPALAGVVAGTGSSPSRSQLGATDAVALQPATNQLGHVLLVPYFTAQQGQMTVLHLANTDLSNGKAIKLRVRGAANGDSLLTMTLLLSPGDMWTGAITAGADGRAQITTADGSCTSPQLAAGVSQPFATDRLDPALGAADRASHTREGSIEAIVAADIPSAAVYGTSGQERSALFTAIRQVSEVAPCTGSAIDAALQQDAGDEATAAARGFATPSGGVGGTWYIIDVPGATTFSSPMTTLQAVNASGQPGRGNYVLFPPTDQAIAQPERFTADPLLVSAGFASRQKDIDGTSTVPTMSAVIQARAYDLPDLSTPYHLPASEANARRTATEVSELLNAREVRNQYALESSITAQTDWVFAMPTKRYSVAMDYAAGARTFSVVPPAGTGDQFFHSDNTTVSGNQVCSANGNWSFLVFSREASVSTNGAAIPSALPLVPRLCGTVSVAAFNGVSPLSSTVARAPLRNGFQSGWAALQIPDPAGLPVTGAAFIKLTNPGVAAGLAGRYGLIYPHMVRQP
ncbi:surface layer protein NpdA [Paracidovorax avenae]|uniref:surface layer protein NpdA n=1 Tax=Paracidovorax avenae TaxID=80867 RepID=UPI000D16319A|nr:surface layer protein NpdA [Paracidovorax avenae]AVS82706.1 surface layer protein NpdA [Paracidovorax avenae]AVS93233.1 surface layer protein NpdA [Paracidovorax avenae]AVS98492.1 surface layer protein NpdA [Paracidovorax avenae]AVT07523.1 surface layer protein NpdA [Paracidovorax avenae]AVT21933.1 surface layer protein NpdA [Paracidovorax avenae]